MAAAPPAVVAGIALRGTSEGGVATCIELPGLGIALDMGVCPRSAVALGTVLVSHGHVDHAAGLVPHCATRAMTRMAPPLYVVPRSIAEHVSAVFAAWRRLDGSALPHRLVPVEPGERVELGRGLVAEAFAADHVAPALGWLLRERRRKLRPEFRGLPGPRIAALRARGVEVAEEVEVPLLAWTGDTRIDALERVPAALEAPLLLLEVTFLDDRVTVEEARSKGHVHLDEVVARAGMFRNAAIVFVHRSRRYRPEEARALLDRRLPPELCARVRLLDELASGG